MDDKYIALVVIISLLLFFIVLFSILSWRYQLKHEPYRQIRNKFIEDYNKIKNQPVILKEIKTNINLPNDERFYLIKKNVNYYQKKLKLTTHKSKKAQLFQEYEADYEFIEQKNNYSLNNRVAKYYKDNLSADMLVTNKQIILKDHDDLKIIKFSKITNIKPTLITIKKVTFIGIIISTTDEIYKIKDDDLNDVLILQTLLVDKRGEKAW